MVPFISATKRGRNNGAAAESPPPITTSPSTSVMALAKASPIASPSVLKAENRRLLVALARAGGELVDVLGRGRFGVLHLRVFRVDPLHGADADVLFDEAAVVQLAARAPRFRRRPRCRR